VDSFAFATRPTIARKAHLEPQVPQGRMDCPEMRVPEANKVNRATISRFPKIRNCIVAFARLVPKDHLVHLAHWVPKDRKAQLDCLALQESPATTDHLDHLDQTDHLEPMELLDPRDPLEPQEPLEPKDPMEIKEALANQDHKDRLDLMEKQEKKEPTAVLDLKAALDLQEPTEALDHLALAGHLDHLVPMLSIALALRAVVAVQRKPNK